MATASDIFKQRRAGILLHPTSLPGTPGNGDLGTQAYRFVDFIADSNLSVWQVLPVGPTLDDLSPYQCQSVHAASPLLISIERLVEKGWLSEEFAVPPTLTDHQKTPSAHSEELERQIATQYRKACLKKARAGFARHASQLDCASYAEFTANHAHWLEDYALFQALKEEHQQSHWRDWEPGYRDRHPEALEEARLRLAHTIEQHRFEQFVFCSQWQALKDYAHKRGVYLFGDMPIFVSDDSVDVWANRNFFLLDEKGFPTVVAGVPPDYFSATGQLWGNPHYNWEQMQADGFKWWMQRLETLNRLFDLVRIDHFRGFESCWQVPLPAENAMNGQWVKVPGEALLDTLQHSSLVLSLVAEDLGVITDEVIALREKFNLPGMKILQFAFDGSPDNPYLPHNHIPHCVVYTGTHDNDTTLGWFRELSTSMQQYVCEYLHATPYDMPWPLIETAFSSVAKLAMIPMQDVLAGDTSYRMNVPGVAKGNWRWRFKWEELTIGVSEKLRYLTKFYERT